MSRRRPAGSCCHSPPPPPEGILTVMGDTTATHQQPVERLLAGSGCDEQTP